MPAQKFADMAKIIPATERVPGQFYIHHVTLTEQRAQFESARMMFGGHLPYNRVSAGTFCVLAKAGENKWQDTIWMSDTAMERFTNREVLIKAWGDVLLVGLGIGMLAQALCRKKEVRTVTVLEIEPDVVRLIGPHIQHRKLRLVVADGRTPPLRGRHFHSIYIDIWSNVVNSDNWPDMKKLLAQYRRYRLQGGLVTAWLKDWCQQAYRREGE